MEITWSDAKDILVMGYGRRGKKFLEHIKKEVNVVAIVDNDTTKHGMDKDGTPIIGLAGAEPLIDKYKIVVALQEYYYQDIKNEFKRLGLVEGEHYAHEKDFLIERNLRKGKIYLPKVDIFLTPKCNLSCENCMGFIPYWKNHMSQPVEQVMSDIDRLFECIDFLGDMELLGGETFLYKDLPELIHYIGENYRDKIGYLGVITNGGVKPSMEAIEQIKRYKVSVSISDYKINDRYENQVDTLCRLLEVEKIEYMRLRNIQWFDFGFPRDRYNYDDSSVVAHMNCCKTVCQMICDGKFYYCSVDAMARKAGLIFPQNEKGIINLSTISKKSFDEKKLLLDCCRGVVEGGYLDICKKCGGFGIDNKNEVETAKQLFIKAKPGNK